MYRIGVDLGGTNIVAGVVDEFYKIVGKGKRKTACPRPAKEILAEAAVPEGARGETLSPTELGKLSDLLFAKGLVK